VKLIVNLKKEKYPRSKKNRHFTHTLKFYYLDHDDDDSKAGI